MIGADPEASRPLCRDCLSRNHATADGRCARCGSGRVVRHAELDRLTIAHLDCDAFYATIEKRDRPEIAHLPVIVGGARRGVVTAACYVARLYGIRSAMPMFKALRACPDAVVVKPDMAKYAAVGRQVRSLMEETTPLVEPISIDEAFLDLSGTEALHRASPAETCARLALRIEREIGITVSIGLSYNKFLAKVASDLDKPRGFAVIGRADAADFLAERPVALLWGVGAALQARLVGDGIRTIGRLRAFDEATLVQRYGRIGRRLHTFARGEDSRRVESGHKVKSVSAETTFDRDLALREELEPQLWRLCERVSERLKAKSIAGRTVVLKLKTDGFRLLTRSQSLPAATQLADTLYDVGRALLALETAAGRRYRLIGIGVSELMDAAQADPDDLLDPSRGRRRRVEQAIDQVRARLGRDAIGKGRGLAARRRNP